MTGKLAPALTEQIKKHRKFLEKEEVFPYAYQNGDTLYYYVVFTRFGKGTGSVILSDGTAPPTREEQLRAGWAFFHFNRVLIEAGNQLVKDIARPVDLLETVRTQLRKAQWNEAFRLDKFASDLSGVYEALDTGVGTIDELNDIFLSMQALEKRVLDRGTLLDEDVQQMVEWNIAHYRKMYHQGRLLLRELPAFARLKAHIGSLKGSLKGEEEQLRQSVFTGLDALTVNANVQVLKDSNASFENDEKGNPVAMKEGEAGLDQHDEYLRKKNDYVFHNTILHDIRNLAG
ncbi:hypothetical protein J31TS4_44720 [Paenibacillus sp. J31TS4]|uniref:hypothetical protein n=1 Tax=Paenibacillus sp. J31TS4 TaxID=2807195 RepID=UPI001B06BF1B|nr:hypothetical protein [Paenibacillus sp. J31TS4]GIP41192.1 hypothetical protein J31TS4_44720 [Paenibacillus sp. J31TS4]